MNRLHERDYRPAVEWVGRIKRPLLISHARPDGDALGSLAGMSLVLERIGARPVAVLYEPYPERYGFMRGSVDWRQWLELRDRAANEFDGLIILDTCATAQLQPISGFLNHAPPTLVLDHHATRDEIGTRSGDLRLFDVSASATALLVAEFARAAGVRLDKGIATPLYVGLATDTGWFRFPSTDGRTMRVGAELVEAGAEVAGIYDALYQQDAAGRLRLIGRMLTAMELIADGRIAVMRLRQSDFTAAGADRSMTEDLINEAGRIKGVELMLLFSEDPDGDARVRMRSKGDVDVAALAKQFGGGGHVRAAGAPLKGNWNDVTQRVIEVALQALKSQ